jgi:hypothetical protein
MTPSEYKRGMRWKNFMGNELRVLTVVDNYVVLRYKGAMPFCKSIKEMSKFLKFIEAEAINNL